MKRLRIALGQLNPVVGALEANRDRIIDALERAEERGAEVVVFPELTLTGYPPEDLLLRPGFLDAAQRRLGEIASETPDLVALLGVPAQEDALYNAGALMHGGEVVTYFHKHLLPNYGVFDEERYFAAGRDTSILELEGSDTPFGVSVSICEDIWYPDGPATYQAREGGAGLMVNLSASPFEAGKPRRRERMLATRAADNRAYLAFCNLVGGQDELVFDGHSVVIDPYGEVVARAAGFEEDLLVVDLDLQEVRRRRLREPRKRKISRDDDRFQRISISLRSNTRGESAAPGGVTEFDDEEKALYRALIRATSDYVEKSGFTDVLVGLSGGIDSALTATIACDALGPERVTGVTMPSRYSSTGSVSDSKELVEELGCTIVTVDIDEIFQTFLDRLGDVSNGKTSSITEENLQPRIRGTLLMALANERGELVLATGNKSELGVGYSTLYGDTVGAFAVLKDVAKTVVYRLAVWRNSEANSAVIPEAILDKPPSAELRDDQRDTDTLPSYDVLDPILAAYVEEDYSEEEIRGLGYDRESVAQITRMVDQSEFKRRQYPPGPKVTRRAFGKDWRLPIVNGYGGRES